MLHRILEEAIYEGKWLVCYCSNGQETVTWLNYMRFLLEKCADKSKVHDLFRIWILCTSNATYLPLTTMTVPANCIAVEELQLVIN